MYSMADPTILNLLLPPLLLPLAAVDIVGEETAAMVSVLMELAARSMDGAVVPRLTVPMVSPVAGARREVPAVEEAVVMENALTELAARSMDGVVAPRPTALVARAAVAVDSSED